MKQLIAMVLLCCMLSSMACSNGGIDISTPSEAIMSSENMAVPTKTSGEKEPSKPQPTIPNTTQEAPPVEIVDEDHEGSILPATRMKAVLVNEMEDLEDDPQHGIHLNEKMTLSFDILYYIVFETREELKKVCTKQGYIPADFYLFGDDQLVDFTIEMIDFDIPQEGNRLFFINKNETYFRITFEADPEVHSWFLVANAYPEYIPEKGLTPAGISVLPIYNLAQKETYSTNAIHKEDYIARQEIGYPVTTSEVLAGDYLNLRKTPIDWNIDPTEGKYRPVKMQDEDRLFSVLHTRTETMFEQVFFLDGKLLQIDGAPYVDFIQCKAGGGVYRKDITDLIPKDRKQHLIKSCLLRMPTEKELLSGYDFFKDFQGVFKITYSVIRE